MRYCSLRFLCLVLIVLFCVISFVIYILVSNTSFVLTPLTEVTFKQWGSALGNNKPTFRASLGNNNNVINVYNESVSTVNITGVMVNTENTAGNDSNNVTGADMPSSNLIVRQKVTSFMGENLHGRKKYIFTANSSSELPVLYGTGDSAVETANMSDHFLVCPKPYGRLGNMLFQFASSVGIARKLNYKHVIEPSHTLLEYFEIAYIYNGTITNKISIKEEQWINKTSEIHTTYLLHNLTLSGYFQSWEYFINFTDEINASLKFKSKYLEQAKVFLEEKVPRINRRIGIHVRRGDFLTSASIAEGRVVADRIYIDRAMGYFRKIYERDLSFIVLSDDIKWCKDNIKSDDVIFSEFKEAIIDLAIMSMCDHMIITVGSFSWWGGWLSVGTVVYLQDFPLPATTILISNYHNYTAEQPDLFDVSIKQWDFILKNNTTNLRIRIANATIFNKENVFTKYILEKYSQIATWGITEKSVENDSDIVISVEMSDPNLTLRQLETSSKWNNAQDSKHGVTTLNGHSDPSGLHRTGDSSRGTDIKSDHFLVCSMPQGRLGNMLFQFASSVGIAHNLNYKHVIDSSHPLLKFFEIRNVYHGKIDNKITVEEEQWTNKTSEVQQMYLLHNVTLNGYFQSWEYFINFKDEIYSNLKFKSKYLDQARKFLREKVPGMKERIGIHVRRGDFLTKYGFKYLEFYYVSVLHETWCKQLLIINSEAKRVPLQ